MRMAWVKSSTGEVVEFGSISISGEPVEVPVTPKIATLYRDHKIVICQRPEPEPAAKPARKEKGK